MKRTFSQYKSDNINSFNNANITNITDEGSRVLDWISPQESLKRHHDVSAARVAGVGNWVLGTSEFRQWRENEDGSSADNVLLCSGIPGAGKTFICSLVTDTLCNSEAGLKVGVACLYCDYRGMSEQDPDNMIRSLLRQFVAGLPDIPEEFNRKFRKAKGQLRSHPFHVEEMIDLFQQVLASFDKSFICIDALDEISVSTVDTFLWLLERIIKKSSNTRLFITGRTHIQVNLKRPAMSTKTITIHPSPDDIKIYLARRLDNDQEYGAMNPELREEIVTNITKKHSEIFLLVTLHIDAILGEITIGGRREKLYQMGHSLSDAYTVTIERIKKQGGGRSRSGMAALMWISLAKRPLKVPELCHALAVKVGARNLDSANVPSIQSILGCCLGLVIVDQETSTVRLIHATLQEYLQSHQDIFDSPHSNIAEVCLSYLNLEIV
ncbi:hypothetical protein L873DRAFT_1679841, partial [Choiromyces venosus 120613-1]